MKKNLLIIALFGAMTACSEGKKEKEESSAIVKEQIQSINSSVEKLDKTMQSAEVEIKTKQSEIDSLLNDI